MGRFPFSSTHRAARCAVALGAALLSGCASVAPPPAAQAPAGAAGKLPPVAFTPAPTFTDEGVQRGVVATRAQCEAARNAVWVASAEHGDVCLRYWQAGFGAGATPRALVFFHGDVWLGTATSPDYLKLTDAGLQAQAEQWVQQTGLPYLYIGRPGTHGSSGDHMQRRRRGESVQISQALDVLKARFGIREWVVAGQSGGGHVTASLLSDRDDIVCAVPGSSVSSPRVRWWLRG